MPGICDAFAHHESSHDRRDAQKALPPSHHGGASIAKNINRLDVPRHGWQTGRDRSLASRPARVPPPPPKKKNEESLMLKESRASGIIASLPEAEP